MQKLQLAKDASPFRNNSTKKGLNGGYIIGLVLALIAVITLSWTPLLFPFRIFTTTVHEASHAFAALLTGGQVVGFQVNSNGSGLTFTKGGWGLLIASAGYLGSTLAGGLMLIWAKNENGRRRLLLGLTAALIFILFFFVLNVFSLFDFGVQRDLATFGLVGFVAALFGVVAVKGPNLVVTLFVYIAALLSTLYAVSDLVNLIFITANPLNGHNDAKNLEQSTHIPALFWAVLWSVIAGFILFQTFRSIIQRRTKIDKRGTSSGPAPKPGIA